MQDILAFIIAIGDIPYKEDSKEILIDYFKFNNIKYFFLEENPIQNIKTAHPSWLKLISHRIYKTDNFILCWDLDLLPINNKKNIRDVLDINKLNMCYDSSVLLTSFKFTPNFKYNGGLIGIPNKYRQNLEDIYNKYAPGIFPSFEQYYLNEEIASQNIEVNVLDSIWNSHFPIKGCSDIYFKNAFNKHYTWGVNDSEKFLEIKKHKEIYFNSLG